MRTDLLKEAFHKGLDLPPDTDLIPIRYGGHPHWDSLGHLSLIVALEEAFEIEFDDEEVLALDSYSAAAEMIAKKKTNQP
ncbi:acyl carrier protein [Streptomyces orinoci]|uniref:Acyl carrier protein n=1 Tax=Streptomyces orinoci TaxID=67339 RepID=A0ABV3JUU7_STRON|nr:acyl carrier protein [Streptomyces orinoci]